MFEVLKDEKYLAWFKNLTKKEQAKVDARISRIEKYGHFGDAKGLGEGLAELRWTNGWRVYFIKVDNKKILLLIGGHKNGQEKDIKKARILHRRYSMH